MFEDEVYEVSRDEFKGFMDQIKPDSFDHINLDYDNYREIKLVSKDGLRHFSSIKQLPNDDDIHYYIYDMPNDDERQEAKMVRKITLGSQEDVKAFFEILSKIQGEKEHD